MRTLNKSIEITLIICCSLLSCGIFAQETNCNNGIDDDNDGFIDCADTECYDVSACDDAFQCSNILYQVISNTLNRLDPLTGEYEPVGDASANYNGAGFNVQDGYIYGIKSLNTGTYLWKINSQGEESDLGPIANYSGRTYVGDFDEEGNLYTYNSGANPSLSYVDVDADQLTCVVQALDKGNGASTPSAADITYNPKFKKFYGLSAAQELFE